MYVYTTRTSEIEPREVPMELASYMGYSAIHGVKLYMPIMIITGMELDRYFP